MASSLLDTDDEEEEEDNGHSGDFIRHSTPRKGGGGGGLSSSSDLHHLSPRRLSSSLSSHSSAPSSTSSSGNYTASSMTSSSSSSSSSTTSSLSSSSSSSSSSTSISLATILEVFQHPISESQAWALVYLAALSLRQLVTDFSESNLNSAELLKLVEVSDVADLLLTPTGAVHRSTWLQTGRKSVAEGGGGDVIAVKSGRSLNAALAHFSALIYKALTYRLLKSTAGEKKASKGGAEKISSQKSSNSAGAAVLLETNLDSLTSEFDDLEEEDEDEDGDLELDINSDLEAVLIFMIRSKDDAHAHLSGGGDDDHDQMITVGGSGGGPEELGDDEGIDDGDVEDEEEAEAEVEADFVSLSSCLTKSALPSVLRRCERHFEEQWSELLLKSAVASSNGQKHASSNTSSTCPILTMLFEGRSKSTAVDALVYYTAVTEQMLDEYVKLKQLLKQLEIEEARGGGEGDDHDGGIYSSSSHGGQLAFRRSSALLSKNRHRLNAAELPPDTESLKVWAQTWIRVMSEMRFGGVHLRQVNRAEPDPRSRPPPEDGTSEEVKKPFNALLEQIRSTKREQLRSSKEAHPQQQQSMLHRQLLQHSRSLPCLDYRLTINQEVIQAKKNSLKPAARRKLAERPPPEPCLHERLMAEIKDQAGGGGDGEGQNGGQSMRRRLTAVETIVKPDIVELYFKERREMQKRRAAQVGKLFKEFWSFANIFPFHFSSQSPFHASRAPLSCRESTRPPLSPPKRPRSSSSSSRKSSFPWTSCSLLPQTPPPLPQQTPWFACVAAAQASTLPSSMKRWMKRSSRAREKPMTAFL